MRFREKLVPRMPGHKGSEREKKFMPPSPHRSVILYEDYTSSEKSLVKLGFGNGNRSSPYFQNERTH